MPKQGATNAPSSTQDQIYSVAAQGNTAKLGQPLPVWYGRLKAFPDFAATPWAEFVGNDQWLNVLLSVSMGSMSYEALYLDDTVLWDPVNGISGTFSGAGVAFYEPGQAVTLFPVNVESSAEVSGQELPDGSGTSLVPASNPTPGAPLGPFVVNPPATQAQSIALDFVFPAGCYSISHDDDQALARVLPIRLIAEFAPVNDAGAIIGGFQTLFDVTRVYRRPSRNRRSGRNRSCEQIRAGLGHLHIGAALVLPQPPAVDRKLETGAVFGRAALVLKQKRPVDQFDQDASVLDGLNGVGDLHQLLRGGFSIGERARLEEFYALVSSLGGRSEGPPFRYLCTSIPSDPANCVRGHCGSASRA
jgi:hypothetical protein